jgi:hypothetical protein
MTGPITVGRTGQDRTVGIGTTTETTPEIEIGVEVALETTVETGIGMVVIATSVETGIEMLAGKETEGKAGIGLITTVDAATIGGTEEMISAEKETMTGKVRDQKKGIGRVNTMIGTKEATMVERLMGVTETEMTVDEEVRILGKELRTRAVRIGKGQLSRMTMRMNQRPKVTWRISAHFSMSRRKGGRGRPENQKTRILPCTRPNRSGRTQGPKTYY